MTWNLRIVYNPRTKQIGFKEVYYNRNGKPKLWTVNFITDNAPKHVQDALSKPVLKENKKSLVEVNREPAP
jgi:hypothetical protein